MDAPAAVPHTPLAVAGAAAHEAVSADRGEKRKRQPRGSACQACASLKMKCIWSELDDQLSKCERCYRMNRECLQSIPKARKRRTLGEAEDSPAVPGSSRLQNGAASTAAPSQPVTAWETDSCKRKLLGKLDLYHNGSRSFAELLGQGLGLVDSSGDLLHGIDCPSVQMALTIFKQLTGNFPFVSVRPDVDAVFMATHRPMTTVAICTVTSGAQPKRQERLVKAFRLALSSKVFLEGQRSLDLLIGLLTFLAWHHNYMSKQQIYQEMCLLAGMAADIGLYRQPSKADTSDMRDIVERDRAFLGCYYICSSLSIMGFNKPNPLRWTDNLRRGAEKVAYVGALPSDRLLVGITELVRANEDLEDALRVEGDMKSSTMAHYVEAHTKAINHRLKALKREHPELGGNLGFGAATIHFHHRLLRVHDTPDIATLIQCASAIKDYLDDVLARLPTTLHHMAIVDWTNLLEILVIMARVARPLPSTVGWEAGALTSMLQPEVMLDSLVNHMASATAGDPMMPRHEAQVQWFRAVCKSIKKRILHERADGDSALRGNDSLYDTVHSLGQHSIQKDTDSRFRPVNEPGSAESPFPVVADADESRMNDFFDLLSNGELDDGMWSNFSSA